MAVMSRGHGWRDDKDAGNLGTPVHAMVNDTAGSLGRFSRKPGCNRTTALVKMEELELLVMVRPDMDVVRFGASSSIDHNNNGGQVSIAVPATARLSHKLENQSLIRRCLSITSGLKNSEVAAAGANCQVHDL
jgi:hypothetical protein